MLDFLDIPASIIPIVIFALRVIDMSFDTLRVLFVIRDRRTGAWITGFIQSSLWVVAITSVLSNLDNPWAVIAYAAGFASGSVVGMAIEERLAVGFGDLRIMSPGRGPALAQAIREEGYAATEIPGRGKDGMVSVITCSVRRRDIARLRRTIAGIDPRAFVTIHEVRPLHRGFWRA
jgi:uncharacterized protein YebE (UPF0316 family)